MRLWTPHPGSQTLVYRLIGGPRWRSDTIRSKGRVKSTHRGPRTALPNMQCMLKWESVSCQFASLVPCRRQLEIGVRSPPLSLYNLNTDPFGPHTCVISIFHGNTTVSKLQYHNISSEDATDGAGLLCSSTASVALCSELCRDSSWLDVSRSMILVTNWPNTLEPSYSCGQTNRRRDNGR